MALDDEAKRQGDGLLAGMGRAAGAALGVGLGAFGLWIAYSRSRIEHNALLPEAIASSRFLFNGSRSGQLSYYVNRQAGGRPLVLIHSINAAASAYEMKPLFEAYRAIRPVYALDLPGFGFSERSRRTYSPQLYVNAILDFLEAVVEDSADVVALSLGCEFAAQAALARPKLFHSLAFISPTGLKGQLETAPEEGEAESKEDNLAYRLFTFPLWERPFYDLLTTRRSIQYFLDKSFVNPVPESMVAYAYATAHQPGAENAPYYFISGQLFTRRVCADIYERIDLPVLVLYDEDGFTSFELLQNLVNDHPSWKTARIQPSMGLPQFERLEQVTEALSSFWQQV